MWALLFLVCEANAQRNYSLIYSQNLKGNTTMFGNTLLHIQTRPFWGNPYIDTAKMNDNRSDGNSSFGNDNVNMVYIDVDQDPGTFNSSSSELILPAGVNTIKFARLYWGGRAKDYDFTIASNRVVKIKKGYGSSYTMVEALAVDRLNSQYQAYADITTFVRQNGAGNYTVANVPLSTGSVEDGGNHGGWTIVVVYENEDLPYNSVRVYDGFQEVYNGGSATTSTVTLTGLNVPSGTLRQSDARMGVMAWEGDANLTGDFLKINNKAFSNEVNAINNPWNGTISNNGKHVTTKFPNYTNNMGIDIDMFDVGIGYNIQPNDTTIVLQFGTESDKYFPGLFTFAIRMKNPAVTINNIVTDENNNFQIEPGEILTYTIKGNNVGTGNANDIEILDTLPATVTYIPNTLEVLSAPGVDPGIKTDATGDDVAEYVKVGGHQIIRFRIGATANAFKGGILAENEGYLVRFKVRVNHPAPNQSLSSIMNIARISARSDAMERFVNEGTAILNSMAGPLPVTLTAFSAVILNGEKVKIMWTTAPEINNSHFIVERSNDGKRFSPIGSVDGIGTTSKPNSYTFFDHVHNAIGTVFYRLRQVDFDGNQTVSNIVSINPENERRVWNVSPNPFVSEISARIQWGKNEVIIARIMDMQGKEMQSRKIEVNKGGNTVRIAGLENLPAGNYILQLVSADDSAVYKITKF